MNEAQTDYYAELQRQAWEEPKRCYDCFFYSAFTGKAVCRESWSEISKKRVACGKFT